MIKRFSFVPLVFLFSYVLPLVIAFLLPSNPTQYYKAYYQKQDRWKKITNPRLMIVGFSTMAFGVDSKMIEDSTCYNVCNYALHGGLGSELVIEDALKNAGKGDVIVLSFPLDCSNDGEAQVQSLGYLIDIQPKKFFDLSFRNQIVFLKSIYSLLQGKLIYNIKRLLSLNTVDEEYNCRNFNEYGDEYRHWNKTCTIGTHKPLPPVDIEKFNIRTFENICSKIECMKRKGAKVVVIPELIEAGRYQGCKPAISFLEKRLSDKGIKYAISPDIFVLPSKYSYYGVHANREGVDWISSSIIRVIKNLN